MAIGWVFYHFTITVKTARNSGMIGWGWLTRTAFDWPNHLPKRDQKRLWPPLSTATSNVSYSCAYRTMSSCEVLHEGRTEKQHHCAKLFRSQEQHHCAKLFRSQEQHHCAKLFRSQEQHHCSTLFRSQEQQHCVKLFRSQEQHHYAILFGSEEQHHCSKLLGSQQQHHCVKLFTSESSTVVCNCLHLKNRTLLL